MAEKRTMLIEVSLDLTPAQNQLRGFVAANNTMTLPVQSPVGAAVSGAGGVGAAAVGLGATTAEQAGVAAAFGKAEAAAGQYGYGASSPNWSYLMAQAQGGLGGAASTAVEPRSAFAGFFNAPRARAILGSALFGLHEIGRAGSAIRNADAMAGFASSPEDAQLLRAEAVEQGSQGFFGSLVFGLPNAFGVQGTPAQIAQEARQAVSLRRSEDDIRSRMFDVEDARAVRAAYGIGGRTSAEAARAERISARRIDEITQRSNNLEAQLSQRTPVEERLVVSASGEEADYVKTGGDFFLQGTARTNAQLLFKAAQTELQGAQEDAKHEARIHANQIARQLGTANLIARGASERDVLRYGINSQRDELGGPLADAQLGALEFKFRQEDEFQAAQSRSSILADTYRAQNNPAQATLVEMRARIESEAKQAEITEGPAGGARVRSVGAARVGAFFAQANRGFLADVRGLTTANAVLTNQLANNPLGAQLAAIQGNQSQALAAVTAPGIFGDIERGLINANAGLQSQLATRNFERNRADVNLHLSGAIERAELAIGGGPSRFIRQQISGLVEQNEEDVRGFIRNNMPAEAARRRELGSLQLRGAEAEFFRSIQYREASPRGVYGTGTLGDVDGAFNAAQAAVSRSGAGESQNPATSQDIKDLGNLIQRLFSAGIPSTAG